jgi:putative membrane protein
MARAMPSEQRLHPASVLFAFARSAKVFLLPGLLLLLSSNRASDAPGEPFARLPANWELWLMLFMIPSGIVAVARYLSFRIRYEGTELVIRTGILFRNERHIPYARIQNLDAEQNVFHRILRVIEVRVETGGGREPEARISVLPAAAFAEMRRRVFEGREAASREHERPEEAAVPSAAAQTLLHLSLPDLLLFGFLENRGLVVITAAYGAAWELGLVDRMMGGFFRGRWYSRYVFPTGPIDAIARGGWPTAATLAVVLAGLAGLLIIVRLISMAWGATRLYDFHLTRAGEDLRTTYGLLTRVATTIPLRRIQTMTIRAGPLHRWLKRCSVQVETAGGTQPGSNQGRRGREWLAPIVHVHEMPHLTRQVLPYLDLAALEWQPPHPRAFRRAVKLPLAAVLLITAAAAAIVGAWAVVLLIPGAAWAIVAAGKYVANLGWASTDDVVAFRSGWLWKSVTVAPVSKIQAVAAIESPFDRRAAMARIRVDTAGGGERSHRVDIPYLARETARTLRGRLAAQAASTAFSTR